MISNSILDEAICNVRKEGDETIAKSKGLSKLKALEKQDKRYKINK